MDAQFLKKLQETHLAVWNERDRAKRDELIKTIYADYIVMTDPELTFRGTKAISDFIDKLHASDPQFYFSPKGPMENTRNGVRLFWNIRTSQKKKPMTGMDFFLLENDKVALLYVFMDAEVL